MENIKDKGASRMQYCEQLLSSEAFESWNALSNAAFVAAALAGWAQARRHRASLWSGSSLLILLTLAIGAGSFAWHATHAPWAELADVLPILGFVLVLLYLLVRDLAGGSVKAVVACGAMLAAIGGLIAVAPRALNGSLAYLPVLVGLACLAVATPWPETKRLLRAAAAVFAVSLTARTLDFAICADYPHGSHWLWHLGNGVVIFLAIKATLVPVRANFHT